MDDKIDPKTYIEIDRNAAVRMQGRIQNLLLTSGLLEELAAVEHEQWVTWSKTVAKEGLTPERIERWEKFWTEYAELDDDVKEYDRIWARKVLDLVFLAIEREDVD
jgi:hypothetical protein